jgi:hypothetical protein
VMCVDPPGAPACTSTDKSAPTLKLLLRNGFLFQSATSRTFFLSWQAQDGDTGSGVGTYDVDVRDQQGAGKSASDWRPLARGISQPRVRFRGSPGKGYDFRVAAVDRAGNRSSYATAAVLVPIDERDKAVRRSRGWRTIKRRGAWGGRLISTSRRGRTLRVKFTGRRAAIVGRRSRKGGRVKVSVGRWSTVRRLRGSNRRSVILIGTRTQKPGTHVLKLRTLGGGPVTIDAIGVEP